MSKLSDVGTRTKVSRATMAGEHASSLLLHEFQHRMANTLTILTANLRLEFATFADPSLKDVLRRCERQVLAAAEFHRFFAGSVVAHEIATEEYFQQLCEHLYRSVLAPLGLKCEAFVDNGILSAKKCEFLGLTITELVMNAAKHAFPGAGGGCVRIQILLQDGRCCCTVSDNGVGMWNGVRGTGSQIIDGLVEALGARLAIRSGPGGTAASVDFIDQAGIG